MTMFDPATGKVVDRDALLSVGVRPAGFRHDRRVLAVDRAADTKTVERLDDATGRVAAHTTLHGSGRVDQTVFPEPARLGAGAGL